MKNTKKTLLILATILLTIALLTILNSTIERDPFDKFDQILPQNSLQLDEESYYVYFYKPDCSSCKKIEQEIRGYAMSSSSFHFSNISKENSKFSSFNWEEFHKNNDIEIGVVNESGDIEFYPNQSKEKYTLSSEKDTYGKVKKYEIIEADEDYLKKNTLAKKDHVYASLMTPNINYYDLTASDSITIANVPTLLHIQNGKVKAFYFDSDEIIEAIQILKNERN